MTKDDIYTNITTKQAWTERAILAIFEYQTIDEKESRTTNEHNGVGFNQADAYILSSFARWLQTHCHLSARQLAVAQRKIGKYAGQLERIIQMKETKKNLPEIKGVTDFTIEFDGVHTYWLVGHGEYPDSSVLAGQYRRILVEPFDTLEEAQSKFPGVEVHGNMLPSWLISPSMPSSAPAWFDESDAGEVW